MPRWSRHSRFGIAVSIVCICSAAFSGIYPFVGRLSSAHTEASHLLEAEVPKARPGFLVTLEAQNGRVRLVSAAEIDNYLENKHLEADDDWYLLIFDDAGDCISTKRIGNPDRFSPILSPEQPLPFVVKIPQMSGLAEMAIYDQHRMEQVRVPVDNSFRRMAAANRLQFLAHERENRWLLLNSAQMRQKRALATAPESLRLPPYERMPEGLRDRLREETALEMERLEQYGSEIMNLRNTVPLEPEVLQMITRPGDDSAAGPITAGLSYPAAGALLLSGQVVESDTGVPIGSVILDFYQYDTASQYKGYIGRQTTDASGNYSVSVDVGTVRIVTDYSRVLSKKYVSISESVPIAGNTTWNIKAISGILLSGTVTNSQNQGVSGTNIQTYIKDLRIYVSAMTAGSGSYSVVVPLNRLVNISVSVPIPYIPPPTEFGVVLTGDTVRNFRLETGWIVTGTVTGEGNAPISRASVLLRHLALTTTSSPTWSAATDNAGKFTFAVSKALVPNSFILAAYAQGYVLQSAPLEITGNATCNLRLNRGYTIAGTVRDNLERPLRGARVRAYQSGTFVNSALTATDGTYSFDVLAGTYEIEALPPTGTTFAPSASKNISVNDRRTMDFVLSLAAGILTIKMYFPSEDVYSRFSNRSLVRFELYQAGLTVYAGNGTTMSGGFDQARDKYYRAFTLYLNGGRYALTSFVAGCRPILLPEVEVLASTTISVDIPTPFLWTGVLRGADKTPLANMSIQSYTDLAREYEITTTNASGQFSILLTPGGFVKFFTDAGSNNILHTERFDNVTAGRNTDVILDAYPPFSDSGSPLTQVYGVADRGSRWNIVMIGDGYTDIMETYTDQNRNGQWDGVLYYDLNKNGVWDTGEPYQRYGNASAPISGADPKRNNEPFGDLNGDGVPNLNDQALFDQNTLDTARSLFGQDAWRNHRKAFNIFRIRLVSGQAGHKILDQNRNVVIDRDTALGTFLDTPERSYLFNANYTLITQYINQYVPECDTRIVMVNQPIRMGRVNSYMFQYGGVVPALGNDYVVAHEMGHNVGLLADEYTEYQETYRGSETSARNVTSLNDPRLIPWAYLIPPGKEIPSVPGSSGVGLYEGAGYYTGGRYRPTEFCMMVSGNRYCPVCTIEIEMRLRDITAEIPEARPRGPAATVTGLHPRFDWEPLAGVSHYILEVEKADGSQLVASYDIYDTSFVLPFSLDASAEYRWRLRPASPGRYGNWSGWLNFNLRSPAPLFTGVFAQIAAGEPYQTVLTQINPGQKDADVTVFLTKSDGSPIDPFPNSGLGPVHFTIKPMGTARLQATVPGETISGYARISSNIPISGTALFKTVRGGLVASEAGIGPSKPGKVFMIYVDNVDDAISGYAVANYGSSAANLTLTLRDASGTTRETRNFGLAAGRHLAEFAFQRFSAARDGFEGSIEFSSDQELAAVALRYDNPWKDVFSTIPVVVDEPATTLYFPQVADGGGYRTNFILLNPSAIPTSAKLEFFSSEGSPLSLPIGGVSKTSHDVPLSAKGVTRFVTDGNSSAVKAGWVKVTAAVAVIGSSIFQVRAGSRIVSEAGVVSSPLARHFTTFVESLGAAESGVAICNPSDSSVSLQLNLRRSTGEVVAAASVILPAKGQLARFFTEWFPRGFGEFEGTLEILASAPVSAVALRYDNPRQDVFATLPVIVLP